LFKSSLEGKAADDWVLVVVVLPVVAELIAGRNEETGGTIASAGVSAVNPSEVPSEVPIEVPIEVPTG
jgi:hypothetical protein